MESNLLRYKKFKYVVFDFETEDLNLVLTRPWQLSYLFVDKDKETMVDKFLLWPELSMAKGAAYATSFSEEKWRKLGEDPREVMLGFNEFLNDSDVICGHNILGFDWHVYNNTCRRLNIETVNWNSKIVFDTFAIFKGLKSERPYKSGEPFLPYQFKMISWIVRKKGYATLSVAAQELGIEVEQERLHDSSYDIVLCNEVFKKLLWKVEL